MSEVVGWDQSKAEHWAELVNEYESSGESQRGFCARRGIGQSTLRYWRRRLQESAGEAPSRGGAQFVAVKVRQDESSATASGLSIVAGHGLRVEVARGFDEQTLERVLVSLRALA
jgi:transposase-like protein